MEFASHGGVVVRLPPGFRFRPTDEELVVQYLRRKVFSYPLPAAVIREVDLGKYDPWDLPTGVSEGEGYFFTLRDGKNSKGSRCCRAASSGYWKAAGKDKAILASRSNQLVGMKKTFVFHRGKPPQSSRTDWIMHEYCLAASLAGGFAVSQKENATTNGCMVQARDYVVCRIFKKNRAAKLPGSGEIKLSYNNSQILGYRNHHFMQYMMRQENSAPPPSPSSSASSSSCVTDISDDADSSN